MKITALFKPCLCVNPLYHISHRWYFSLCSNISSDAMWGSLLYKVAASVLGQFCCNSYFIILFVKREDILAHSAIGFWLIEAFLCEYVLCTIILDILVIHALILFPF